VAYSIRGSLARPSSAIEISSLSMTGFLSVRQRKGRDAGQGLHWGAYLDCRQPHWIHSGLFCSRVTESLAKRVDV